MNSGEIESKSSDNIFDGWSFTDRSETANQSTSLKASHVLKVGDTIYSSMGIEIKIESLLSAKGGQGYVYCVNYGGSRKILKWYKSSYLESLRQKTVRCDWQGRVKKLREPDNDDDKEISTLEAFYNNLSYNAKNKPSNIGRAFVCPIDVTNWSKDSDSSFGYIMDIIDIKTYKGLTDYYTFQEKFVSRQAMLTCCLNIVELIRELHLNGLSWGSISDNDIYIDPNTGNVWFINFDDLLIDETSLGLYGNIRYMAPEIVLGNAPDKFSDRFSMALILFRIMMGGQHPFEGKYSEENSEKIVYGKDPVFIFDDTDKRNVAVPTMHRNAMIMWPQYPEYIKSLFKRTFKTKIVDSGMVKENQKNGEMIPIFTDANRETRPLEEEWIRALIRLRGEMVDCPKCKTPVFLDVKNVVTCPNCNTQLTVPCEQSVESAKKAEQAISDAIEDKSKEVCHQKSSQQKLTSARGNDLDGIQKNLIDGNKK